MTNDTRIAGAGKGDKQRPTCCKKFCKNYDNIDWSAHKYNWKKVRASSFADPADVVRFDRCKATGKTDRACFAIGDNGIGKWGHKTAQTENPMAAFPREIWGDANKKGGAKILVRYNGVTVEGILGDTLPSLSNIRNNVGIDLNPAFAKQFKLKPPFLVDGVEWTWVD